MKQMKRLCVTGENTDYREGAHSCEEPFAWAEVREKFPYLFMLSRRDRVGTVMIFTFINSDPCEFVW
jgi:hypothetical protein